MSIRTFFVWFITFFVVSLGRVEADVTFPKSLTVSDEVHAIYDQTKLAIRTKDRQQYWRLQKRWQENFPDHVLFPYLERYYLLKFMNDLPKSVIEAFLQRHANTDFIRNLQFQYLAYLSTRDKRRFNQWVEQTPWDWLNPRLRCQFLKNTIRTPELARQHDTKIARMWSVPLSQDKRCDSAFRQWRKAGLLTPERVMSRIKLVAEKGHPRLIVYLTSLLPEQQQHLGKLWGQVANSPGYVRRMERWGHLNSAQLSPVVYFGLRKLLWQDMALTQALYADLPSNVRLTPSQHFYLTKNIAIRLALNNDADALLWLGKANRLGQAENLTYWTITQLARAEDWQSLNNFIAQQAELSALDNRAQYWQARALHELGQKEPANKLFSALAKQRHYYGFMAAQQLGQKININEQMPILTTQKISEVAELPTVQAAFALHQVGERWWALRAWEQMLRTVTDKQGITTGILAHTVGWHDRAIHAMAEFGQLDAVSVRFPQAYKDEFTEAATEYDQSLSWLYGIARRESAFDAKVQSRANAYGLMQILPSTANYLSRSKVRQNELTATDTNTLLGAQYLDYLSNRLSVHPVLRTAAYNAGWSRVTKWLPLTDMALDIWIETIPFKETREYVQAVIAYEQIYAAQLATTSVFDYSLRQAVISADDLTPEAQRVRISTK